MTTVARNETADRTKLELPADCEILISRTFSAPARIVFEAITRPEHVSQWWAPKSRGQMILCEADVRVGGTWRNVMRTRDGMEVGFHGTFLELVPHRRVVQTEIFDPFPEAVSTVTVTLTELNGSTKLESRVVYPSKEVRDQVIASGMEGGMRESYQQLAERIDTLARSA